MNILSRVPIYRLKTQKLQNKCKCICLFGNTNIPDYVIKPKYVYVETLKITSKDKLNSLMSKYNINMTEKKMYDIYENYKGSDNDKDVQITLIVCVTYIYYLVILLFIYCSLFF